MSGVKLNIKEFAPDCNAFFLPFVGSSVSCAVTTGIFAYLFKARTNLLISKRELQNLTTLNVDQKGIDFIYMLLDKSPATLNSISEKISEVLQDGVLNTDDVPILINLVKDIMNMDRNKISISMLSIDNVIVFIKTIFEILIIKDHIKVENKDKIFQLMDISFLLLTTSLDTKVNLVDCIKRLFKCA
mgnify:CR=1 FL=1